MHTQLTLSVCKRRDVVRLALNQPARPAGAAFGGLSASAASWAAPRHACASCVRRMGDCLFLRALAITADAKRVRCSFQHLWQNLGAEAAARAACMLATDSLEKCGA